MSLISAFFTIDSGIELACISSSSFDISILKVGVEGSSNVDLTAFIWHNRNFHGRWCRLQMLLYQSFVCYFTNTVSWRFFVFSCLPYHSFVYHPYPDSSVSETSRWFFTSQKEQSNTLRILAVRSQNLIKPSKTLFFLQFEISGSLLTLLKNKS